MAYTYEKQLWKDYPDTTTPITADRLNHMEDGIKGLSDSQVSIEVVDSLDGNSTTNPPSVRAVNDGLRNVKGQILWTNSNPNNAISKALDITLSSGDYDFLEIITKQTTTDNRSYVAKIPKGSDGRIYVITLTGICAVRNIRYDSDTAYTLGTISGGGETVDATWCIPIKIIGYKTGLFS